MHEKKICVEKTSLKNTDSHKMRRKIRIFFVFWRSKGRGAMRKIRICRSSQETYLLRSFSCVEHVVASKTNRRFAQKIRKDPKMKKKTISVTVTCLLISKTGSSESHSKLSSLAELTRVQAECQQYMKSPFNTGRFTRRARNRRSNARRFFSRSSPFVLVYFPCFLQFLAFFFFQE